MTQGNELESDQVNGLDLIRINYGIEKQITVSKVSYSLSRISYMCMVIPMILCLTICIGTHYELESCITIYGYGVNIYEYCMVIYYLIRLMLLTIAISNPVFYHCMVLSFFGFMALVIGLTLEDSKWI